MPNRLFPRQPGNRRALTVVGTSSLVDSHISAARRAWLSAPGAQVQHVVLPLA